jgi:hypothetical protein
MKISTLKKADPALGYLRVPRPTPSVRGFFQLIAYASTIVKDAGQMRALHLIDRTIAVIFDR